MGPCTGKILIKNSTYLNLEARICNLNEKSLKDTYILLLEYFYENWWLVVIIAEQIELMV